MLTTEHFSTLDSDSKMIIEQYDKDQRCFVFGDIKKVLIANDIADIFGNPNERKYLEYIPPEEKMKKTTFMSNYFLDVVDRVTKTRIEASIKTAVAKRSNEECADFASLVCLYFYNTLLLCNSSTQILWKIVGICENLIQIQIYNWAMAMTVCLNKLLVHANKPHFVTGCVSTLLIS